MKSVGYVARMREVTIDIVMGYDYLLGNDSVNTFPR
jgi:hypothetical protein